MNVYVRKNYIEFNEGGDIMLKEIKKIQKAKYDWRLNKISDKEFGNILLDTLDDYCSLRYNGDAEFVVNGLNNKIKFESFWIINKFATPIAFVKYSIKAKQIIKKKGS